MKKNLAFLLCALASAFLAADGKGGAAAVPKPEAPLLAHWTFDEPSGTNCADASGQALSLRGTHALRTNLKLATAELPAITFSVGHPSWCGCL